MLVLVVFAVLFNAFVFYCFGSETVLYAPIFVPLLLIIASETFTEHAESQHFAIGVALLLLLMWNNIEVLISSREMAFALAGLSPGLR